MDTRPRSQPELLDVTVSGPVASSVIVALADRYDGVTASVTEGGGTVITVLAHDQAGERAVLTLLWDTGHQIRSVVRRGP